MKKIVKANPMIASYPLAELTAILIKDKGLHEGLYNLAIEFKIAVGGVGPNPESQYPGAMVGISGVGLTKTPREKANAQTVDAAEANPAPKKTAIKKKKV